MSDNCCCKACNIQSEQTAAEESNAAEEQVEHKISIFRIVGLDCADCAAKLESKIAGLQGVLKAAINFGAAKLTVKHTITEAAIIKAVQEAGYQVEDENEPAGKIAAKLDMRLISTFVCGILLAAAIILDFMDFPSYSVMPLYIIAIVTGGWHTAKSAYYSVKHLSLDMNFLMSVAVLGAGAIGEWSEAAVVVFLFSFGNMLQAYTLDKTRQSIQALMKLAPREALVRREGQEISLKVEEIKLGDIVIVKPGERIAMDGIVVSGMSSVNQAAVTGESVPVEKEAGDEVYAGTVNENGSIELEVSKLAADSTIARIMQMVEDAQAQKAPAQQLVDKFAKYYTPAVLLLAVGIALIPWLLFKQPFGEWFYMALVLLVISCPCALVLSTPVSIVSAIGSASRHGVLIKGGAHLEQMNSVKVIAFDKTGTLTQGKMAITDIVALKNMNTTELLILAASLESLSEHPIAKAIALKAADVELRKIDNFKALPGRGVQAEIAGKTFWAGNIRLFTEMGYDITDCVARLADLEEQGKTVMLIGGDKSIYGMIAVADTLRENSTTALAMLRHTGIQKIVMLTGDNRRAAAAIGQKLGLDEVYSELLPGDKVNVIKKLAKEQGCIVMVGDGINDAPALAVANIGVAMGVAGSDAALEAADIALMVNDLTKLSYVVSLSRKTLTIIKQNISFAILIKALFIILTLTGMANLWLAVFADTGAAVLVTLNGMRLAQKTL